MALIDLSGDRAIGQDRNRRTLKQRLGPVFIGDLIKKYFEVSLYPV